MHLIDFNISIANIEPVRYQYVSSIKFYQEIEDLYDLFNLVIKELLIVGFSNSNIMTSKLIELYFELNTMIAQIQIYKLNTSSYEQHISEFLNWFDSFIIRLDLVSSELVETDSQPTITPSTKKPNYCNVEKERVSFSEQRRRAAMHAKMGEETIEMRKHDKPGGGRRTKKKRSKR
jgi:hypothetical protein